MAMPSERDGRLFLSYAHIDNEPLLPGQRGWIESFTMVGPPLHRRLSPLGPLATPVAMSVAAQVGVLVPSVLVFGRFSVIGIVANLVAVPVAGLVMLYGLPASLVAGAVPARSLVVMLPGRPRSPLGRRRGHGGAVIEQRPPWNVVVAIGVVAGLAYVFRAAAT